MKPYYLGVIALALLLMVGCMSPAPQTPTPSPSPELTLPPLPPIETGKGRITIDNSGDIPEKIITRKIVDEFLIGVGTTDPGGCVSSTILEELRANGVNYFLPFPSWASIERAQGVYTGTPCPGEATISWLNKSGAVLNGHCLLFLINESYAVPRFAFGRTFEEQKEMIGKFVRATVKQFPQIPIWTLNEPVAQNCFGWTREQVYDVFVSASKWVHEANPEAKVMVNMIPIQCNWGGLDYEPGQVLTDLLDRGVEADIVGIELYYWWAPEGERDENGYPKLSWVKSRVDIFRKSNLPIIFSEVGIPGMIDGKDQFEKQADWMESFFRFCHDDKDIIGATWYFVRDDNFMPYAGLANNDYTYRPIGMRLMEIANEWNPSTTHYLAGKNYVDLEPGEYDVIVSSEATRRNEVYRVSIVQGQAVSLGKGAMR